MSPGAGVGREVAAALGAGIRRIDALAGGCISPAFRVTLEDGRTVFVKTAPPRSAAGLLEQEVLALRRLRETDTVRVPAVLAAGGGWLALEWLEPCAATPAHWAQLGRELARLHRCSGAVYGWESDNYIGPLPQRNQATSSWPEFWADRRLRPQLDRARARLGAATLDRFDRLLDTLGDRLDDAAADGPSLLHGDLWSGNVHMTVDGPAVIDPSCSYGHREVDLAMADLFGGFAPQFFDAYAEEWPLRPGAAARRPIYQLYYLLVHVNLFGAGYIAGTERALDASLRADD